MSSARSLPDAQTEIFLGSVGACAAVRDIQPRGLKLLGGHRLKVGQSTFNSTIPTVGIQRRGQLRPRLTRIALQFATKLSSSICSMWLRIEALRNSAMIADASSGNRVARSASVASSSSGEY